MKTSFKKFIKTAHEGQIFFDVAFGTKYKIQAIGHTKTNVLEYNKRDKKGDNIESFCYNDDNFKIIW